jgi:hypothetical protein
MLSAAARAAAPCALHALHRRAALAAARRTFTTVKVGTSRGAHASTAMGDTMGDDVQGVVDVRFTDQPQKVPPEPRDSCLGCRAHPGIPIPQSSTYRLSPIHSPLTIPPSTWYLSKSNIHPSIHLTST